MINQLFNSLINTLIESFYFVGVFIFIGIILEILRKNSIKNFLRSMGNTAIILTGIIGVPIHELSHAIVAILFGHKIVGMKLFQMPDYDGIMGYVRHIYNKRSIYQQIGNFFIGIAPMIGGSFIIILLMKLLMPDIYVNFMHRLILEQQNIIINKTILKNILMSYYGLTKTIFALKNFANPYFYLFLFISICISSHISLSTEDIKSSLGGFLTIFIILFVLNILGLSRHIIMIYTIKYNILLNGILIVSIILSAFTYILSLLIATFIRR